MSDYASFFNTDENYIIIPLRVPDVVVTSGLFWHNS